MPEPHDVAFAQFRRRFGHPPMVCVRAPGRVNLIGEHTDYSGGYALPFAVEQSTHIAAAARSDGHIHAFSITLNSEVRCAVGGVDSPPPRGWQRYLHGVVRGLARQQIPTPGADVLVTGDLPIGAGMSSSAALCVGWTLALLALAERDLEPLVIAQLAQQAEHEYGGTPCGIMDPYTCLLGRSRRALLLDCAHQEHRYVPLQLDGFALYVLQSGVQHELSCGLYAQRVSECQAVAQVLSDRHSSDLREANLEQLKSAEPLLKPPLARRARHVITENRRVLEATRALENGELQALGPLLNDSHESLRDDFEVSCPEIEALRDRVLRAPGVMGARMIGGGFGGSILILAHPEVWEALVKDLDIANASGSTATRLIAVRPAAAAATAHYSQFT